MDLGKAHRREMLIKGNFPESIVEAKEDLVSQMQNAVEDRHVLATAIQSKSQIIVTYNLKDFPDDVLTPLGIKAQHPDDFLCDLCDQFGYERMVAVIKKQAEDLKNPPMGFLDVLSLLDNQGLSKFASQLATYTHCLKIDNAFRYALSNYGRVLKNGLFLEGNRYKVFLSSKKYRLTISSKDGREAIFSTLVSPKSLKRRVKSSMKPDDTKVLHIFGEAVSKIIKEREEMQALHSHG